MAEAQQVERAKGRVTVEVGLERRRNSGLVWEAVEAVWLESLPSVRSQRQGKFRTRHSKGDMGVMGRMGTAGPLAAG